MIESMETIIPSYSENDSVFEIGFFKKIAEGAPVGILLADSVTRLVVYANPAFVRITGYNESEIMGRNCSFLQGSDTDQVEILKIREALSSGSSFHGVLRNYRKDGSLFYNELSISPVTNSDGAVRYFVGYQQDVTQEKRRTLFLEMLIGIGELLNETLFEQSSESILEIVNEKIIRTSLFHIASVSEVKGTDEICYLSAVGPGVSSVPDVCGNPAAGPCPLTLRAWRSNEIAFDNHYPDNPERQAIRGVMVEQKWYSAVIVPIVTAGKMSYAMGLVSALYGVFDAEAIQSLQRIKTMIEDFFTRKHEFLSRVELSRRDPMTGLVNRLAFGEIFSEVLIRTRQKETMTAIVYVDLDGFKMINDSYGHEAGDRVLTVVGERLRQVVRTGDTAVRLGGDEFLLLLEGMDSLPEIDPFLERIAGVIGMPIAWKDVCFSIQASFGVTVFPTDSGDVDSLLHHADQAMYIHKRSDRQTRGPYVLYDPLEDSFDRK
ncbi:MAG: diguanylate cyclase domain-containing protein [Leptospirillum sp.]|jgi:diguanylate cyclase (GGDEF)-like protein/PAS domain S-box-containing protein